MTRKFDEIEADLCDSGAEILTGWRFYQQQQEKRPDAMIIMRHYEEYLILGNNADKAAPVLMPLLTHKHAGRMYCYDRDNYSYHRFSFGKHNLDKALPALIRAMFRVAIIDYDIAFQEWGGWERVDCMIAEAKTKREAERPKVWVQASLFDQWGI